MDPMRVVANRHDRISLARSVLGAQVPAAQDELFQL
jgi:hypothetical protein